MLPLGDRVGGQMEPTLEPDPAGAGTWSCIPHLTHRSCSKTAAPVLRVRHHPESLSSTISFTAHNNWNCCQPHFTDEETEAEKLRNSLSVVQPRELGFTTSRPGS